MKKIISAILVLCMGIQLIGVNLSYAAADENGMLLYDTFDDTKTNDKPIIGKWILNGNSRVMEDGKKADKFMSLNGTLPNSVTYELPAAQQVFVMDFEMELMSNNAEAVVSAVMQSGSKVELLKFAAGESAETNNNYRLNLNAIGKKTRISLAVNSKLKAYSIYKDGRILQENYRLSNLSQGVRSISIDFSSDGTAYEAHLDNVYIYEGKKLISEDMLPKTSYNSEAVEYTEKEIKEEPIGNTVITNEDFENAVKGDTVSVSGINLNNKGNPMRIEYDRSTKSNYLVFEGFASDPHIDVNLTDPPEHLVFQMDVRSGFFTGGGSFWLLRDTQGRSFNLMNMSAGTLSLPDGTTVVKLEKNSWHNVAAAVNFLKKTYSVYLDGKLIKSDIVFGNTQADKPSLARIHITGVGSGGSQYCIDNYRIYEAAEPDFSEKSNDEDKIAEREKSVFESDEDIREGLQGLAALYINAPVIWAKSEKKILDAPAKLIGDKTYVPVRVISETFGENVEWNGDAQEVTIGNSVVKVGSKTAKINGTEKELEAEPIIQNERCLLPLRSVCEEILNQPVYWNDGLVVIGSKDYTAADEQLDRIKDFVRFYRPNAEQIKADYQAAKDVHPKIIMTRENMDRINRLLDEGNEKATEYYNQVLEEADAALDEPVCTFTRPDNYRLLAMSQTVLRRMMVLGIAYMVTGDSKYPERAWLDLKAAGEFETWNYVHHLDVGEMTAAFAVGYDWMYDYWSDTQKKFITKAMYEKSLLTYYNKFMNISSPVQFKSWMNGTNWNAVCNGGTIVGALAAAEDYPDVCYDLIAKCMRSTEIFWKEFGPQGSWPEGPGYVIYALEYIDFMISSMDAALGTDYGLINMGEIGGLGDFMAQTDGFVAAFNYGDTAAGHQFAPYLYWLANARNDVGLGKIQTRQMMQQKNKITGVPNVETLLWYSPEYDDITNISFPLDAKFEQAEVFAMRSSWTNNDGIYLAGMGGYNNYNHWHIGSGNYVLDAMGERWASDYGPDNYNAKAGYFSANRYKFYRVRAEGHNCVVINPDDSSGQEWAEFAPITRFESSDRSCISVVDLSKTYKENAESYRRAYMLGDGRRTVTIRDEIELKESGDIYWFLQTFAEVDIESEKKAVLSIGFKKMIMEIASEEPYEFYVEEAAPLPESPEAEGQGLPGGKRVVIKYTGQKSANVTVKFTPYDYYGIVPAVNNEPIDSWKTEDGAYDSTPPRLNMIYLNGEPLDNFSAMNTFYRLSAPDDIHNLPNVTADAPEGVAYEVWQAKTMEENTRIKVYEINNPDNAQFYNLGFVLLPKLPELDGKTRYTPIGLTASSEPEPENTKEKAFNGIIGDRWAASGTNEWLLIDLGEEKEIDKIGTAFISGDARVASYAYKISNDKQNWETVFDGKSSGKTTDFEFVSVSKKARYIRFEGYGNSVNSWNSISEIAILAP